MEELEVWQDLASVYTELKQWSDARVCLEKAQALNSYSPTTWHAAGESTVMKSQNTSMDRSCCHSIAFSQSNTQVKLQMHNLPLQCVTSLTLPWWSCVCR